MVSVPFGSAFLLLIISVIIEVLAQTLFFLGAKGTISNSARRTCLRQAKMYAHQNQSVSTAKSFVPPPPSCPPCLHTSFSILIMSHLLFPVMIYLGFPMTKLSPSLHPCYTLLPWCLPESALIVSQCLSIPALWSLDPLSRHCIVTGLVLPTLRSIISTIPQFLSLPLPIPSLCSVPVVSSPPPLRPF